MSYSSVAKVLAPLALVIGLALGCGPETGPAFGEAELGSAEQGITRSFPTVEAPWSVRLGRDVGGCSGVALTRRWFITAGHCLDGLGQEGDVDVRWGDAEQSNQRIYNGGARFFVHPDFAGAGQGDRDDDIGLVQLTDGAMGSGPTTALIFYDDREPWRTSSTENRYFHQIGWGRWSNANGTTDCNAANSKMPAGSAVKRIGYGFRVNREGNSKRVSATMGGTHACGGDSGSPYIFARRDRTGVRKHMAFAIHSGRSGGKQHAALIRPKWLWIRSTMTNVTCTVDHRNMPSAYRNAYCRDNLIFTRPRLPVAAATLR